MLSEATEIIYRQMILLPSVCRNAKFATEFRCREYRYGKTEEPHARSSVQMMKNGFIPTGDIWRSRYRRAPLMMKTGCHPQLNTSCFGDYLKQPDLDDDFEQTLSRWNAHEDNAGHRSPATDVVRESNALILITGCQRKAGRASPIR